MKFFYKMFLGMTVILAVALGMIEYVTLSYSLEHAVKREQDSALSQHQMIKYSIETVILNMKSEDVDKELTDMMSQSEKSIVGDEGGMYLADDDGKRIYANSCNYEQKDIKVKDGTLTYSIVSKENGRGIPPEDIERITEAFYMVDKSRSRSEHGAGLGLALVSRIAKLHDTKIHYESESGKGTRVYFDMKAEALDEK